MSSSPRAEPTRSAKGRARFREPAVGLPFSYSEVIPATAQSTMARSGFARLGQGDPNARLAPDSVVQAEVQARALARQQGELEGRAKFEERLARERSAVAQALVDFARDRADYYQKVEEETVRLALSIARKVLHREAQVDPLLLMGIVRVALEKIEGATGVVLAVHPQQIQDWQRFLSCHMNPGTLPEIVEDPALAPEQCVLRTSMGTAELGLEIQLKEIERGLMDLLAARPLEKR